MKLKLKLKKICAALVSGIDENGKVEISDLKQIQDFLAGKIKSFTKEAV